MLHVQAGVSTAKKADGRQLPAWRDHHKHRARVVPYHENIRRCSHLRMVLKTVMEQVRKLWMKQQLCVP